MVNPIGLLTLAVVGCGVIARMNRSSRLFFGLLLALAIGFVGGAVASDLSSSLEKNNITATINVNYENGNEVPTAWVVETPFVWKATTSSFSSMLSNAFFRDNFILTTPRVQTVHPVRCLSPPSVKFNDSS